MVTASPVTMLLLFKEGKGVMSYRYRKYYPQCKEIDCNGKASQKRCPTIPLKKNGIPKACGTWVVELRDSNGKWTQESLEHSNKTEAQEQFQILMGKRADGVLRLKRKGIPTLKDYCNTYLQHVKATIRESSYLSHERTARTISKHSIGDYKLTDINTFKIEKFRIERLQSGIRESSTNADIAILRLVLGMAKKEGIIRNNPVEDVKRLKESEPDKRVLTDAEIQLLLRELTGRDRVIVLLSLFTGLRLGDCLALRWESIDLQKSVIALTVSKTDKNLTIPIDDYMASVLVDYKTSQGNNTGDALFYEVVTHKVGVRESVHFTRLFRKLGIANFSFHCLRHTHATLLSQTSNLVIASEMLGHSTASMTMHYVHVDSKEKRDAIGRLSDRILCSDKTIILHQKSAIHST